MVRPYRQFTVVPSLPPRLVPLRDLAYNIWWSWNPDAVDLFRRLDHDLWEESGHNPVLILGRISQDRLQEAANDDGFLSHMMRVYQTFNRYISKTDTWYNQHIAPQVPPDFQIAYFSAEFGLTESLPMYSGGLGVLAGDHLKSASDLGLPLAGVGLLYQEGYFRQYLNADGWQQELYPVNDFHTMPIELVLGSDGKPVTVQVEYPAQMVTAQVWRVQVGRVPLYLLDTNLEVNRPEYRDITDQLYGGDLDMRIRQEIMLGIGGMRALTAVGVRPTICHMNEGHSAFLGLERVRMAMQEQHLTFAEARELVASGNVFTTHTPVPAGIDLFPPYLIDQYFANYREELGLSREAFLQLGRRPHYHPEENFSMAVLALRLADSANGVSRIHGATARAMWQELWPHTPENEVPITSITNGIHSRSWISGDLSSLYVRYLGPRWIDRPADKTVWERVERIPDEELWRTHERRRERMVSVARERLRYQLERHGAPPAEVAIASEVLHPDALTIGFARRFATYKRAALLFTDVDRLSRILNQADRPVQIIFAGKAHPRDNPGKEFIRQIVHYSRREDLRHHIIFLEDYDMALARYMVQGVDVWLNNPRVGMEASGTSGMKAALNGVLNLSTCDGWWCEAYNPSVGWRIGQGETYDDVQYWDQIEAQALYNMLEKEVVPLFYDRGADGLPRAWIRKMKNSIRAIAPEFNTDRMVQDYATRLYLPAAEQHLLLGADDARRAKELAAWLIKIRQHWGEVRIESIQENAHDGLPVGTEINLTAWVSLGALQPEDVAVQIYHGIVTPQGEIIEAEVVPMARQSKEGANTYVYQGVFASSKTGLHGYAVRVLPFHENLKNPHIPGMVVWSS
jgi:starch phosphorylase